MILSQRKALMLPPLQLAYIGDAVYTLRIRLRAVALGLNMHQLHRYTTRYVSATAQAKALEALMEGLTDREMELVKRGRNTHARHSVPKSATSAEYAAATGLESLIGYLYLTGQKDRIDTLVNLIDDRINAQEN
ncbi:MAG: ribonuclease III domain-containing protein [Eubacteriales bacterium]|jgi:ribonuclease-3 family protein|nr:ribonuclease III domain-containing protein [Eubacteriales bacterium]MDD3109582.1 ribonuclease III domain-containing protein [Eubacteriales bacterium]MDD3572588.1 ribonuclease III domain-containing protein [Eubacteriales bacterium]MDD4134952.1 ribonuclease III domain-containing protein [Eubacteriales bacterium]NLO12585.1 ribonuclease III [Clostridiales bacterium]